MMRRSSKFAKIAVLTMLALGPAGILAPAQASWDKILKDTIKKGEDAVKEGVDKYLKKDQSPPSSTNPQKNPKSSTLPTGAKHQNKTDAPRYDKEWVREIQTRLKNLGYNPGPADGAYGKGTKNAIRQFQFKSHSAPHGLPRPSLMQALRAQDGSEYKGATADTSKPAPASAQPQATAPTQHSGGVPTTNFGPDRPNSMMNKVLQVVGMPYDAAVSHLKSMGISVPNPATCKFEGQFRVTNPPAEIRVAGTLNSVTPHGTIDPNLNCPRRIVALSFGETIRYLNKADKKKSLKLNTGKEIGSYRAVFGPPSDCRKALMASHCRWSQIPQIADVTLTLRIQHKGYGQYRSVQLVPKPSLGGGQSAAGKQPVPVGGAGGALPTPPTKPSSDRSSLDLGPNHPIRPGGLDLGMRLADAERKLLSEGFRGGQGCTFQKKGAEIISVVLRTRKDKTGNPKKPRECRNPALPIYRVVYKVRNTKITDKPPVLVARMNDIVGGTAKCTTLHDSGAMCTWYKAPNASHITTVSLRYMRAGKPKSEIHLTVSGSGKPSASSLKPTPPSSASTAPAAAPQQPSIQTRESTASSDAIHPLRPGGYSIGMILADAEARLLKEGFFLFNRCTYRKRGTQRIDIALGTPHDRTGNPKKPLQCRNMARGVTHIFYSISGIQLTETAADFVERMNQLAGEQSKCTELRDKVARCSWIAPPNDPNVKSASVSLVQYGKGTLTFNIGAVDNNRAALKKPVIRSTTPPKLPPGTGSASKAASLGFDPLAPAGVSLGMKSTDATNTLLRAGYRKVSQCYWEFRKGKNVYLIHHWSGRNQMVCESGDVTNIKFNWSSYVLNFPSSEVVQTFRNRIGADGECSARTDSFARCDWKSVPDQPDFGKINLNYTRDRHLRLLLEASDQRSDHGLASAQPLRLKTDKSVYSVGETVSIQYSHLPIGKNAIIELVPEGTPVKAWQENSVRTRANTKWGELALRIRKAGKYEIRGFVLNDDRSKPPTGPNAKLSITVKGTTQTSSHGGSTAAPGGTSAEAKGLSVQQKCESDKNHPFYSFHDCKCIGDKVRGYYLKNPNSPKSPTGVSAAYRKACPSNYEKLHAYYYKGCAGMRRDRMSPTPDLSPKNEQLCQCSADYAAKAYLANPRPSFNGIGKYGTGGLVKCRG
jgi:Putative peptidoglycan binding domain